MLRTREKKNTVDLILNLIIILSTIISIAFYFIGGPDVLGSIGKLCFAFFTTDSNILAAIASAIMLFFNIKCETPPKWVFLLKYTATVAVMLTFITVVCFLAPLGCISNGWKMFFLFFAGNVFVLHFSTPVLSLVSLIFFERDCEITLRDSLLGMVPTVIYSVVYLIMVLVLKKWPDWYGFTFGGKMPMAIASIAIMYLLSFGIANLLRKLRNPRKVH